jgi:hypothetical protein
VTYETPRTWTPGELVTEDMMNQHVRDNVAALAPSGVSVVIGTPGGGAIAPGTKMYIPVPKAFTITGWIVAADQAGSIVFDVYADAYANFPPDAADSIVGSEPPSLSAQQIARDLSLTTWTADIDEGDVLAIVVDSASTVECVTLTLTAMPR